MKKLKLYLQCLGSNHHPIPHKNKPEKVKEQNPQESGKKQKGESVENLHKSAIVNDAWRKNKMTYVSLGTVSFILRKES